MVKFCLQITDSVSVFPQLLLDYIRNKRIFNFEIFGQLLPDYKMGCVDVLSVSFVIDPDFYVLSAISFLVMFKDVCAYSCHNFFLKHAGISVPYLYHSYVKFNKKLCKSRQFGEPDLANADVPNLP